jgi:crotonobetainyl-CoA:carnitine CoA-transferase CaiB-like acyl-CoA transferase
LPEPDTRPAPYHGEHSRIVCREWLGLGDDEIDAMLDNGVLQGLSDKDQQILAGPSA